jgi:putative intracellular protease/amidase/YHS domain-containing protein
MNRRDLLRTSATLGLAIVAPLAAAEHASMNATSDRAPAGEVGGSSSPKALQPPAKGRIPVAFLLSDEAVIIDFCGPWEVFENVTLPGQSDSPFQLYTVAETTRTVRASGGMKIVPDYTIATAPAPKIIVIPAQSDPNQPVIDWIRSSTRSTDVTMSVCTGAFVLAKTGLLSGRTATTHHQSYLELAMQYPDIRVKRGARFVEDGNLASAGGLSSGIDLSLRVVERYYGRAVALQTADWMEYQGKGWLNPDSNQIYSKRPVSTAEHPLCPICDMEVDPKVAPKSTYLGKIYYFCQPGHKHLFDSMPGKVTAELMS